MVTLTFIYHLSYPVIRISLFVIYHKMPLKSSSCCEGNKASPAMAVWKCALFVALHGGFSCAGMCNIPRRSEERQEWTGSAMSGILPPPQCPGSWALLPNLQLSGYLRFLISKLLLQKLQPQHGDLAFLCCFEKSPLCLSPSCLCSFVPFSSSRCCTTGLPWNLVLPWALVAFLGTNCDKWHRKAEPP